MGELCVYQDDQTLTSIPGGVIRDIPRVGNDVRRLRLTGSFAPWQQFNGNFVESRIYDAEFRNVDLTRCDWKDCRVIGVVFENCKLGHASFITNSFEGCEFVSCQFPDTGISDCVFKSCTFNACDFTDVIIKSSHIEKTDFINCKTSNRVVESSLLIDTHWKSMAVDARLIFGNFGLLRSELEQCCLVVRNPDGGVLEHNWANLGQVASKSDLSPIEYLRYRNFETEDLESDADALEAALDWRNWKGDVSVQASFGAQLSSFAKFLIALFERDRLPVYPLLILHARNFEALSQLEGRTELMDLYEKVAGVHWILAKQAEVFLQAVEEWCKVLSKTQILHVAAEGPLESQYFESWLGEVGLGNIKVVSVRPRNSPVDLALLFEHHSYITAFVSLFLSTKTKLRLAKVPELTEVKRQESSGNKEIDVFVISMGLASLQNSNYQLSVKTLLPKHFLLDLQLGMSVVVFQKARKVLVDLLSTEQEGIHKH